MSETTKAANALIQWFNSQEINKTDALAVMNKVIAKIIVGGLRSPMPANLRDKLDETIDRHVYDLVHEINEQLYESRPRRSHK